MTSLVSSKIFKRIRRFFRPNAGQAFPSMKAENGPISTKIEGEEIGGVLRAES